VSFLSFANPENGDPKLGMTILFLTASLVFRQMEELIGAGGQYRCAEEDR
jgi:hypothetical protein